MSKGASDDYKVWLDYMVTYITLNLEQGYNKENRKWHIKTFDEFCAINDELMSECLSGWRWRFEDRIFKRTTSMWHEFKK